MLGGRRYLALLALLTLSAAAAAQLLPSIGGGLSPVPDNIGRPDPSLPSDELLPPLDKGLNPATQSAARFNNTSVTAQLLPPLDSALNPLTQGVGRLGDTLSTTTGRAAGIVDRLAQARIDRLDDLVRRNPRTLEHDVRGDPAVKGELIVLDAPATALRAAASAGFTIVEQSEIEGLGIRSARLQAPRGMTLARAERRLEKLIPEAQVQSNPIYHQSGRPAHIARRPAAAPHAGPGGAIGLIDSGVAPHPALPGNIVQRGFARGAPAPGQHGTAIASILVGRGMVHGVSPRSRLYVADIYGRDPRGGNALAIARALGWLVANKVVVVNISLAGPANPLLARAVAAADQRGVLMVAAVGNDGAAAPPAFPASYPQVIAVTGIDRRGRALIEAGKTAHLDFAAPGADLIAARVGGGTVKVRGTSFAAPFVTGRLARLAGSGSLPRPRATAMLAAEADKPRVGRARLYGRGIICGQCATR